MCSGFLWVDLRQREFREFVISMLKLKDVKLVSSENPFVKYVWIKVHLFDICASLSDFRWLTGGYVRHTVGAAATSKKLN